MGKARSIQQTYQYEGTYNEAIIDSRPIVELCDLGHGAAYSYVRASGTTPVSRTSPSAGPDSGSSAGADTNHACTDNSSSTLFSNTAVSIHDRSSNADNDQSRRQRNADNESDNQRRTDTSAHGKRAFADARRAGKWPANRPGHAERARCGSLRAVIECESIACRHASYDDQREWVGHQQFQRIKFNDDDYASGRADFFGNPVTKSFRA